VKPRQLKIHEQKPMSKNWKFFKESVRHFWQVGSLVQSSRYLVDSLLADVDFAESRLIVEFGAGSGCVTRELLRRMRPDARLFSFELSQVFHEEISSIAACDPRLTAVHGCAMLAAQMFAAQSVDCVVSGLPMGNFGKCAKLGVLSTVHAVLKPGGHFSQFQYSLLDYRLMKRHFPAVRLGYTPLNFPPAFVYNCVSA
jgi:phospholipid N-methyltransferase